MLKNVSTSEINFNQFTASGFFSALAAALHVTVPSHVFALCVDYVTL